MTYKEIEGKLKSTVYSICKDRTTAFLDMVDALRRDGNLTRNEDSRLDAIMSRGRRMFMEQQDELLNAIKCLMETGDVAKGIDKRGGGKS